MQKIRTISLKDARLLALNSQLLLNGNSLKGKTGLLKIIEQLGYVQIDTISVVERAHRHVLWTRLPGYSEEMLNELIDRDKKVFEYWSHAAAFLPMKDFRYAYYRKRMFTHFNKGWGAWAKKNKKIIKYVHDRIKAEGPLQSRDFGQPKKRGTWWDWKPAKYALDYLFHTGELMLRARKNFQKIYDLAENILPPGVNTTVPTDEEHSEHLILSGIRANGVITANEIVYQRFYPAAAFEKTLKRMLEEKLIIKIKVEDNKQEYYTTDEELNKLNRLKKPGKLIFILSPFDNLVIQRKRLKNLFNFDYVIECYVPLPKRKFGYYCMPVMHGDKFIGRVDAKADRQNDSLNILNYFPEDGYIKPEKIFSKKLKELAEFAGCSNVSFI